MSTRLRTCSPTLLHGGAETDGEHALSHESPSVVLMRALAWLPACLNSSIPARGRAQRARSHICASPCVTDRGRAAAADDDGVGLKTTLQESHGGKFGRHVEKGRSSVHGCHVALASAGLGLSRLSISPVRQESETTSAWLRRWSPPSKSACVLPNPRHCLWGR